ncbi:DUF7563 family protein [Natronorarus salvus]|uniref:DUF7563 family protein n=1 Tax=Natronorarus salvus TaxID=3117733 RepID=UPI002F2624E6
MGFEPIDELTTYNNQGPQLSVYPDGGARISAEAVRRWLNGEDRAGLHWDRERGLIGLAPGEEGAHTRVISSDGDSSGATISVKTALNQVGVEGRLDQTVTVPLEWDDDHGMMVGELLTELEDLGEIGDGDRGDADADDSDQEGSEEADVVEVEEIEPHPDEAPEFDIEDEEDLQVAYDKAGGNIAKAAEMFGESYNKVYARMRSAGVHQPNSSSTGDQEDESGNSKRREDEHERPSLSPTRNGQNGEKPPRFVDFGATPTDQRTCQNCGAHVTKQFARTMDPEETGVRCCPNCPDLIRDQNEGVREKKYIRSDAA